MNATITLSVKEYKGETRLFIAFPWHKELVEIIKQIPGVRWSRSQKQWHLRMSEKVIIEIETRTQEFAVLDKTLLEIHTDKRYNDKAEGLTGEAVMAITTYRKWMEQKRYSDQTVKNYINQLLQFLRHYQEIDFKTLTVAEVEQYNHDVIITGSLSYSYQSTLTGTLKLFYSLLPDSKMEIEKLDRPFRQKKLPDILNKTEIMSIIQHAGNTKNVALLSTIYGCGLRIGEALALKLRDLDKERNLVKIVQAREKKTGMFPTLKSCEPY